MWEFILGAIKLHLPVEAFIACSQQKRPDNTLFPDVCSFNVGYDDLETYLPLVLGCFEVTPEGGSVVDAHGKFDMYFSVYMISFL